VAPVAPRNRASVRPTGRLPSPMSIAFLFSSSGLLRTAFGGGVEKLAEICKLGGVDVRDGPVFGAPVAPDLNGIAGNYECPCRWRTLRWQGGKADEMLIVPVDQDRRGRAGDDIDPASGKRKALKA